MALSLNAADMKEYAVDEGDWDAALADAVTATRMGVIAYALPFLFVLQPSLIGIGSVWAVVLATGTATFGAVLLGVAVIGYTFRPIGPPLRLVFLLCSATLLVPHRFMVNSTVGWIAEIIGGALAVLVLFTEWRHTRQARRPVSPRTDEQRIRSS